MALIATYKLNEHSVYVSDFRLTTGANTNSPIQLDISNKFMSFNNNFGLLLAGDVNLWQQVISSIYNLLNSNNINLN